MKAFVFLMVVWVGIFRSVAADFMTIHPEAERLYAEKSFEKARELYEAIDVSKLETEERRWVELRRADTLWRSSGEQGMAPMEKAKRALEDLIRGRERPEEQDRIWAEAQESLGQLLAQEERPIPVYRRGIRRGPVEDADRESHLHLKAALDWWGRSRDIDLARRRYIELAWWIAREQPGYPELDEFLENAARIANSAGNQSFAHLTLAQRIVGRGNPNEIERAAAEFEAALGAGKENEWYDDALFAYAQWLAYSGRVKWDDQGNAVAAGNRKKALELFRQLLAEFAAGQSPFVPQARQQIQMLEGASLNLAVLSLFAPDTVAEFNVNWQNVRQIEFMLRRIDLLNDIQAPDVNSRFGGWGGMIRPGAGEVVKRWTRDVSASEEYTAHSETIAIEGKLATGAYALVATGAGKTAQELILVTDVAVVTKSASDRDLIFVCNADSGAPVANASVKILDFTYDVRNNSSTTREGKTDANGLAELAPNKSTRTSLMVTLVSADGKPGFASGYPSRFSSQLEPPWKVYVVTDRPAYRPGETAHWKITARRFEKDVYATPAGEKVKVTIMGARGEKILETDATLNSFGSAWGDLELKPEMALGPYQILVSAASGRNQGYFGTGSFRLEEYKLPEFKVTVQAPEENGRSKIFRLGEKAEITVKGEYYFGGAVANASVHVVVRTNGLYHIFREPRMFPWLFADDFAPRRWRVPEGDVAFEKDLTTDAEGKATFSVETAAFGNQDVEFSIEARMTDSSRREIIGNGKVRVTKHRYQVFANAEHWIHRSGDKVQINFKALDANDQGVAAEGKIKVTRDFWYEIWEDPSGREVRGEELKQLKERKPFPPDERWKLRFRGYEKEDITAGSVKTDAEGKGEFAFTPQKEGYYNVTWLSEDKRPIGSDGPPIKAETQVWVATGASTELGFRRGDLEIILDKDSFRVGQKAAIMLSVSGSDRYVLLTIGTDRIFRRELVHLTGTAKLIEVEIGEEHVPNFWIQAVMVKDQQIFQDTKEVVVPPVKNFLQVEVKPERNEYRVRDDGKFIITTKDHEGKSVPAEISFGLIDESIFYIGEETAGDPRKFFYGTKRYSYSRFSSTFDQRAFSRADRERLRAEVAPGSASAGRAVKAKVEADFEVFSDTASLGARSAMPAAMLGFAGAGGAAGQAPIVRSDFRTTVFWQPDLKTDADGTATVSLKYPDSVTTWKGTARAASAGNQFGYADASTRTTQPVIVRLQAPRFFVVGDEATISSVINNNTDREISVASEISVEGLKLLGEAKPLTIAAHEEGRVDWKVIAEKEGEAKIRIVGKSAEGSDSMERTYPVHEHGIEKFVSESGKFNGSDATVKLDLPARKNDSTKLIVQVTPSLAVTMLDALPYLLGYPYGCTEQTMSRFLPAAVIAKTLKDVGLDAETAMGRAFGGIEAANAAKIQKKGKRNLDQLNEIVQAGLERLRDMQHGDGGWGWWKEGRSDSWMTAYVVWGLALARGANLDIEGNLIDRSAAFLDEHLMEAEEVVDLQAWMLHALAAARKDGVDPSAAQKKAVENVWNKRETLTPYSRALFAMATHGFGDAEKAKVLVRNLENGVIRDANTGTSVLLAGGQGMATAHWGEKKFWWRWSESDVEGTAFALAAILEIEPENKLVEPVANWLIKNRRGAQWSNTRDTAITLLALTDFLKKSGELKAEVEFEVAVNGTSIATKKVSGPEVLNAPSRFTVDAKLLRDGANEIRIVRKSGNSPLYFATEATYFSLEEPVKPAANEIFARRRYYRLAPYPTLLKGNQFDRVLLKEGETITSGDRLEVSIIVEAKNDYEYLIFEDLKPGGFEAVQIRSGNGASARRLKAASATREAALTENDYEAESRWIYQELRDRKVASFIDQLPQGFWEIRYELRAETPGKFHALPTLGHAMYVPEIRCNSAEDRVTVQDSPVR